MNDNSHFLMSLGAALKNEGKEYYGQRCIEIAGDLERRHAAPTGWQPMDTAPKDGTEVFLPLKTERRAYWCKDLLLWVLSRPVHMEHVAEPAGWRPTGNPLPSNNGPMT